ncbi:hypothetical protein SDC9_50972 [bioreactor metagenome]|uniref:Uncharacterized protein n=1 Tax=bioreactor metagenome TaxID=1076179 RepID=A0A644WQY9_9ZZZZ
MQTQKSDRTPVGINHKQGVDFMTVHQADSLGCGGRHLGGDRGAGCDLVGDISEKPVHVSAQVAVGDDTHQHSVAIHHAGDAETMFGHSQDRLRHRDLPADDRNQAARMHHPADGRQPGAQPSAGVEHPELLGTEAAPFHHGNGERVAEGERQGRRGCRRQPQRAGLLRGGKLQPEGGGSHQRRSGFARDAHDRNLQKQTVTQQIAELGRLAGIGNGDDHVAGRHHSEVAVARLPRMKVERRRSGGGERRRDLARDMPGFPHPCHDDTADGFDEEPDDLFNVLRQPVGKVRERLSLEFQRSADSFDDLVRVLLDARSGQRSSHEITSLLTNEAFGRGNTRGPFHNAVPTSTFQPDVFNKHRTLFRSRAVAGFVVTKRRSWPENGREAQGDGRFVACSGMRGDAHGGPRRPDLAPGCGGKGERRGVGGAVGSARFLRRRRRMRQGAQRAEPGDLAQPRNLPVQTIEPRVQRRHPCRKRRGLRLDRTPARLLLPAAHRCGDLAPAQRCRLLRRAVRGFILRHDPIPQRFRNRRQRPRGAIGINPERLRLKALEMPAHVRQQPAQRGLGMRALPVADQRLDRLEMGEEGGKARAGCSHRLAGAIDPVQAQDAVVKGDRARLQAHRPVEGIVLVEEIPFREAQALGAQEIGAVELAPGHGDHLERAGAGGLALAARQRCGARPGGTIGRVAAGPGGVVMLEIIAKQDLGAARLEGGAAGGKARGLEPVVAVDKDHRLAAGIGQGVIEAGVGGDRHPADGVRAKRDQLDLCRAELSAQATFEMRGGAIARAVIHHQHPVPGPRAGADRIEAAVDIGQDVEAGDDEGGSHGASPAR